MGLCVVIDLNWRRLVHDFAVHVYRSLFILEN